MAMGIETKRIYVIPSLDRVAVRLGEGDSDWNDDEFIKLACPRKRVHPLCYSYR